MTFSAGTKLGTYEIVAPLGAGGMGEVYRARDPKLKRDVAIKALPEAFSQNAERTTRFQREAEVLASLNHPHIAAIYELAEFGESRFLVLELVEGETLADRIARGGVPMDEALEIARQIAEALEAAHEKGIIHRDLKPANIKITADGNVKVLDFGLAKVREGPSPLGAGREGLSNSPTMMSASVPGMILGTAAYMSPEQAKGRDTDRATDVWAFGCVLYEMLSGHRVFDGETIGEIFGGVFKAEPDWNRLPADTPEGIRRLLRRCLRKEEKLRLRDLREARIEIEEVQSGPETADHAASGASRRKERFVWVAALTLVALIAIVAASLVVRLTPLPAEVRLDITTPPTADPVSLAISPDGQKIVFVANSEDGFQLWVRSLDSVTARTLVGTEGASYPFWSPDSRSVGFYADGKLKRVDIDGGSVQTLATAPNGRGGAWSNEGVILFTTPNNGPIFRVSAMGGEPAAVTRLEAPQQSGHRLPQFLPDGRHFLYYVVGTPEARGIYIGQLDGSGARRILDADGAAVYMSSGQLLLFVRQGTLFAQDFDPVNLTLTGNPFSGVGQVAVDAWSVPALSASAAGPIVAYRSGPAGGSERQFVWFDRSGQMVSTVGGPDGPLSVNPSMSSDGRRVVLQRTVNGNQDIWFLEIARGVLSRFTSDPAFETAPIWSADGTHIVFGSNREGTRNLYRKAASGAGSEELLLANPQPATPEDWSPDGRFLLYRTLDPRTGADLWVLPLDGDRKPFPLVQTNFDEIAGQFSPDGRWIAYQSNESGRVEVYVQPFPGPGGKFRISTNGGAQVRWRRDGKEIYYIALDGRLMAAAVQFPSAGQFAEPGTPAPLFVTRVGGAVQGTARQQYVVSPDGQFLMNTVTEEDTSPITIILNWKAKP